MQIGPLTGPAGLCQPAAWLAADTGNEAVTPAPEIAVSRWFNTDEPLTLAGLRGRPVLLHAFQMLCPGCVAHGTPQTQRAFDLFKHSDLQVIGLHTVFEHHAAMTPVSLEAFIHEYRLTFPIGVDEAAEGVPIPVTMGRYGMQGTPTSILIGRDGSIVHHGFGQQNDMALGAIIAAELAATRQRPQPERRALNNGQYRQAGEPWSKRNKKETQTMAVLPLIVFDVNETLLDLETMQPIFQRIFGDGSAMRLWFANLILYSAALTVAGCYVPFTDIGSAVMKMMADTRGIKIDDKDKKELTEKFSTMPPHAEVPGRAAQVQRAAGFLAVHTRQTICWRSGANPPARGTWRHCRSVRAAIQCRWRQASQAVARGLWLCRA